jgi:hypothetical protein
MIKLTSFLLGWILGIFILNKLVFELMIKFIQDPTAVAILCICLITVYTVVWGVIVGLKK